MRARGRAASSFSQIPEADPRQTGSVDQSRPRAGLGREACGWWLWAPKEN
jgi:hypothetical protein